MGWALSKQSLLRAQRPAMGENKRFRSAASSAGRTTPSRARWLDRQGWGLAKPRTPRQGWRAQSKSIALSPVDKADKRRSPKSRTARHGGEQAFSKHNFERGPNDAEPRSAAGPARLGFSETTNAAPGMACTIQVNSTKPAQAQRGFIAYCSSSASRLSCTLAPRMMLTMP